MKAFSEGREVDISTYSYEPRLQSQAGAGRLRLGQAPGLRKLPTLKKTCKSATAHHWPSSQQQHTIGPLSGEVVAQLGTLHLSGMLPFASGG